jgi:type IV secretion system protein TrbL
MTARTAGEAHALADDPSTTLAGRAGGGGGGRRARRFPLRHGKRLALLALLALFFAFPVSSQAQPPPPDGILDGLIRGYHDLSLSWLERIQPLAQRTFAILATLELAVSGLFWAIGRESLDAIAASLLRKFIVLAFLFSLLTLFPFWIPAITIGFQAAGQAATQTPTVNPSQVLDLGGTIASKMLVSYGVFGFLVNPAGVLLATITSFFVVLSFCLIAAQICLTLIETYLVLTGGALFLGFAGFRSTAPLAEGYLVYAFQVGAKIYLLYLLLGVGMAIARTWADLNFLPFFGFSVPTLVGHFQVMGGSIIFCILVWYIPRTIATRLVQGVSFHLTEAIR